MVTTPFPVAAQQLLQTTLLDALRQELRDRRWSEVRMADVARTAGVSRQTLYKTFGTREGVAQAFVLREADALMATIEQAVQAHLDDPREALAAAFAVFLTAAAEHPLVRTIVAGDADDELLPLVTTQGRPVLEQATERLGAFLQGGWPALAAADAQLLAEGVVRLAISYAALPSAGTEPTAEPTAEAVARLLGPFVERALSPG